MALSISKETPTGVNATYWKVYQTEICWHEKRSRVVLVGYLNEEMRRDGKKPLGMAAFDWNEEDFPFTFEGNAVAEAYIKIKTDNVWSSAEDC